jgi:hypothetical protein
VNIIDDISDISDALHDLSVGDAEMTGPQAFDAMRALLTLRNLIDHHAAVLTAALERLRVAKDHGRGTRELLIVMGFAPAAAQRLIRVAGSLTTLPTLAAHAADGVISGEHADAIVRGIDHIGKRSPEPIDDAMRLNHVTDLLGQHFSGATPSDILDRARTLGNVLADDTPAGCPPPRTAPSTPSPNTRPPRGACMSRPTSTPKSARSSTPRWNTTAHPGLNPTAPPMPDPPNAAWPTPSKLCSTSPRAVTTSPPPPREHTYC